MGRGGAVNGGWLVLDEFEEAGAGATPHFGGDLAATECKQREDRICDGKNDSNRDLELLMPIRSLIKFKSNISFLSLR